MDKIQSRFSIISSNITTRKLTPSFNNFVPALIRKDKKQIIQSVHIVKTNGKVIWYVCKPNKYIDTNGRLTCVDGSGETIGTHLRQLKHIKSVVVVIQDNIRYKREMIVYNV